ncbi:MAG: RDD family protein [Thermoplasmatota archaeon]
MEDASLASRIIAYLIDGFILFLILFFSFMLFYSMFSPKIMIEMVREQASFDVRLPLMLYSNLVIVGYFTIFESSLIWNATPGKRLVNIEVYTEYGGVTLFRSFLRNITRVLWSLPCIGLLILGLNIILIADSDRRMGDMLAGTRVVIRGGSSTLRSYNESTFDPELMR